MKKKVKLMGPVNKEVVKVKRLIDEAPIEFMEGSIRKYSTTSLISKFNQREDRKVELALSSTGNSHTLQVFALEEPKE